MLSIFRSSWEKRNSKNRSSPPVIIAGIYQQAFSLAEQIKAHAEHAPYPHIASQLRDMGAEKERNIAPLKEILLRLGAGGQEIKPEIQSGRNHWERMKKDLEAQKALERALYEQASLLAEQAAELSQLLLKTVNSERPHKQALFQLVMRADPQASLT